MGLYITKEITTDHGESIQDIYVSVAISEQSRNMTNYSRWFKQSKKSRIILEMILVPEIGRHLILLNHVNLSLSHKTKFYRTCNGV